VGGACTLASYPVFGVGVIVGAVRVIDFREVPVFAVFFVVGHALSIKEVEACTAGKNRNPCTVPCTDLPCAKWCFHLLFLAGGWLVKITVAFLFFSLAAIVNIYSQSKRRSPEEE
jgi:hypothetical protein